MAVGFGPVPDNTTTNRRRLPQDVYRTERIALAINQLPKSSNECGATLPYNNYGRVKDDDKCNWKYLTDLPGHSEWTFDGVKGGLAYVNIQHIGTAGDLLVGYATNNLHTNMDHQPLTYRLAKISKDGTIKLTKRVPPGLGWGEDDHWTSLSNGCIFFPYVGVAGPGGKYSNGFHHSGDGLSTEGADRLRATVVCDDTEIQGLELPPPSPSPPPEPFLPPHPLPPASPPPPPLMPSVCPTHCPLGQYWKWDCNCCSNDGTETIFCGCDTYESWNECKTCPAGKFVGDTRHRAGGKASCKFDSASGDGSGASESD